MMGALATAARRGRRAHRRGDPARRWSTASGPTTTSDELLVVDTMRERKALMEAHADAFLALPGGVGTCEELFEVWTSGYLRMHAQAGRAARPGRALHRAAGLGARPGRARASCGPRRSARLVVATDVDAALDACAAPAADVSTIGQCDGPALRRSGCRAQDRALVMAIVNRTPDSFYDRGAAFSDDAAMAPVDARRRRGRGHHRHRRGEGRPGRRRRRGARRSAGWSRSSPPCASRHPDVVISVDTWRGEVGRLAVAEGADLLNDTWAGADPTLGEVAAETGVGIVCSHTGGAVPRTAPAPRALRRRRRRRDRRRVRPGRAAGRARRAAGGASSSTPPTTSARTPSTGWPCCAAATSWWPPAGRC